MKTSSKVLLNLTAIAALTVPFVPAVSLARGSDDTSSTSPSPSVELEHNGSGVQTSESHSGKGSVSTSSTSGGSGNANFCQRFASLEDSQTKDFDQRATKLDSDLLKANSKRESVEAATGQKVADDRAKADQLRQEHFTKLESDATTSAQTAAVKQFEATIQAAVTTRRTAVDKARDTFRVAVATSVSSRQAQVTVALSNFHNAVSTAYSHAQASCAAGTSAQTVQQTLKAALQTAHANLKSALQAVGKVGSQVSQLAATRNAAVKAANEAFTQSVKQAAATLKAALGQTDDSPSPSPATTP